MQQFPLNLDSDGLVPIHYLKKGDTFLLPKNDNSLQIYFDTLFPDKNTQIYRGVRFQKDAPKDKDYIGVLSNVSSIDINYAYQVPKYFKDFNPEEFVKCLFKIIPITIEGEAEPPLEFPFAIQPTSELRLGPVKKDMDPSISGATDVTYYDINDYHDFLTYADKNLTRKDLNSVEHYSPLTSGLVETNFDNLEPSLDVETPIHEDDLDFKWFPPLFECDYTADINGDMNVEYIKHDEKITDKFYVDPKFNFTGKFENTSFITNDESNMVYVPQIDEVFDNKNQALVNMNTNSSLFYDKNYIYYRSGADELFYYYESYNDRNEASLYNYEVAFFNPFFNVPVSKGDEQFGICRVHFVVDPTFENAVSQVDFTDLPVTFMLKNFNNFKISVTSNFYVFHYLINEENNTKQLQRYKVTFTGTRLLYEEENNEDIANDANILALVMTHYDSVYKIFENDLPANAIHRKWNNTLFGTFSSHAQFYKPRENAASTSGITASSNLPLSNLDEPVASTSTSTDDTNTILQVNRIVIGTVIGESPNLQYFEAKYVYEDENENVPENPIELIVYDPFIVNEELLIKIQQIENMSSMLYQKISSNIQIYNTTKVRCEKKTIFYKNLVAGFSDEVKRSLCKFILLTTPSIGNLNTTDMYENMINNIENMPQVETNEKEEYSGAEKQFLGIIKAHEYIFGFDIIKGKINENQIIEIDEDQFYCAFTNSLNIFYIISYEFKRLPKFSK